MNNLLQSLTLRAAVVVAASLMMTLAAVMAADDAQYKDLNILQRPVVDLITPPEPNQGRPGTGLAVRATVDRPDRTYKHGENLVLTVETTEDAYVWVFDTGTSGKVHQIYPNRYEEANFVAANTPLEIPRTESKYHLVVSHPRGAELLTIIASKDKTPPLTAQMIDEQNGVGPFLALRGTAEAVAKDLSITLREQHSTWTKADVVVRIE